MRKVYIGAKPFSRVYLGGKPRQVIVGYPKSLLPNEYAQLEYIESTGTQCIDTGISGGVNAEYEIQFNPLTAFKQYETYFGGDITPPVPKVIYENSRIELQTYQGSHVAASTAMNTILTIKYNSDATADCNGTAITSSAFTAGAGWGTLPFYIFRSNQESTLYATMRLYALKMWTDSVLMRDFIPAKRKSDGMIGLYDLVSGTFFTDANGGNFTGGDEV